MLKELLDIAALAPSVGLSEPWRFVTVDDPARRAAVRGSFAICNAHALSGQTASRATLYARLKLEGLSDAVRMRLTPDRSSLWAGLFDLRENLLGRTLDDLRALAA